MAFLEAVVNRILEQWSALELFFPEAALLDNLQAAKCIFNALRNLVFKAYYTSLSYNLSIVNKLNLIFQATKPVITNVLNIFSKNFKTILKNFLKTSYVDRTDFHKINPKNVHKYLRYDLSHCQ